MYRTEQLDTSRPNNQKHKTYKAGGWEVQEARSETGGPETNHSEMAWEQRVKRLGNKVKSAEKFWQIR